MDKQLSQMSFDESDSTPGLIDSDSEDLPPKIQDINNIIDTSTPRDSHKDRGDATGEDIIDLESDSIDGNEDSVSDTAANDPVDTFPDKGKEIKPPREWLSLEPRRVVNLFHPNGKSYLYDRAKMSLFNCEFSSVTREQGTSRAMGQFVHAIARIVEVDAQGNKSTLLGDSNTFDSRKGGNETHAEQFLLDDMYSRLRLNIKEKRHEIATQYMILVLAQNMVCDGIDMDGSLCGNCVCALNKFHFLCGLDASKLKVITPRMPRQDETGDLKSISAVTKIKRRWGASELGEIDLTDVEYVPCTMNPHASPETVAVNGDTTVEDIIKENSKHYTSSEDLLHLPCCHFSMKVGKHRFEL